MSEFPLRPAEGMNASRQNLEKVDLPAPFGPDQHNALAAAAFEISPPR